MGKTGPEASFFFVPLLLLALLLVGCGEVDSKAQAFSGEIMGTSYHIKVVADGPVADDLAERLHGVLDKIDRQMSTYKPESDLSRFNRADVSVKFPVPAELMTVLQLSAKVFEDTEGAFDPTVGPLVDLWGFGPDHHEDQVPDQAVIDGLLKEVGFDSVVLDPQNGIVAKTRPVSLDLSAVAKGYAADQVGELLKGEGLSNYMVEIGGEMALAGANERGLPWQIAIEKPDSASRSVQQIVGVSDAGVATSGDYRNYFEKNGVRYSHTIDPRTGYPITHALASVTVVAESSGLADALATAFMVMGTDNALKFAEQHRIAIFTLSKTANGFAENYSSPFKAYLKEEN